MNASADMGNPKQFGAPLAEVLQRYYENSELWALYDKIAGPILGEPKLERIPRKDVMVSAIVKVLNSVTDGKRFFQALAPDVQKVLALLAWAGDLPLLRVEAEVGFPITDTQTIKPNIQYDISYEETKAKTEFPLIALDPGSYYRYSLRFPKDVVVVRLPPALRACLRKIVPAPKGYTFEPVERLPEGLRTYRCDETIQEDLRMVADYIHRGHLQYIGNGNLKKSCLRAVSEITRGGEFFPVASDSPQLSLLRVELLVNLLASCDEKIRRAMLSEPPDPAVILRDFLSEAFTKTRFFHDVLLSHLSGARLGYDYQKEKPMPLWAIFSKLSSSGWVTADNLLKYQHYREISLDLFYHPHCRVTVDYKAENGRRDRHRKVDLTVKTKQDFLITPLLQGTAFLLAALGFAEIAYALPTHPTWQRDGEEFLTAWDGLFALRLTPLGAYALKQTDEVTLNRVQRQHAEVFLNPDRLTVTSRNIDPVTELSLLEFMEKLSDGCFRMTRKSFLHGCITDEQVQARIEQFKSNISATPPAAWQTFLDDLSQGVVALKCKSKYKVYDLTNTPGLRQLFSTDPLLKEKTLKVEKLKIAISKTDLPLVTRRLADLGYLVQ
jgi:hypothetical protein